MSNIVIDLIVGTNDNINEIFNDIREQANQLLPQTLPPTINNYAKINNLINYIKDYYTYIANDINDITTEINNIHQDKEETMHSNSESLDMIKYLLRKIKNSTHCLKKQISIYHDAINNIDAYFDISEEDNCYTDMQEVITLLTDNITELENQLNK